MDGGAAERLGGGGGTGPRLETGGAIPGLVEVGLGGGCRPATEYCPN